MAVGRHDGAYTFHAAAPIRRGEEVRLLRRGARVLLVGLGFVMHPDTEYMHHHLHPALYALSHSALYLHAELRRGHR